MTCKLIKIISLVVVMVGLAVMIGWIFNIQVLKSVLPEFVAMKFTTAICFVLSGLILYFFCRNYRYQRQGEQLVLIFLSFAVSLIMISLFLSVYFGIKTGMEDLFVVEPEGAIKTAIPGRPALMTMVSFVLIAGAGLIGLSKNRINLIIVAVLGATLIVIGSVAIIGYLMDAPKLYYYWSVTSSAMALHAGALFVLLGLGFVAIGRKFLSENYETAK